MKTDDELKQLHYAFLGWMNGWDWNNKPDAYVSCKAKGHKSIEVSHSIRGSDNTIYCDICKIWWKCDSSD